MTTAKRVSFSTSLGFNGSATVILQDCECETWVSDFILQDLTIEINRRFVRKDFAQYDKLQFVPAQYDKLQFVPAQYDKLQFVPVQYDKLQFVPAQYDELQFVPAQYDKLQFVPAQYDELQFVPAQCAHSITL
ncbi:MAG: hypothetical protein L6Q45_01940 [Anaerolineales bacterium]|nr:hypothetical protein [Anaerolineales bacterium]